MFALMRALTYATLFAGFFLVFLPARVLERSGLARPADSGVFEVGAGILVALGGALALWCVVTFALRGRGTPAPFDPPRQLVVEGPYRRVRNPMYLGAGLALSGAALYYRSLALLGYAALFLLVTHAFVLWYEEPTLRRLFGQEYEAYCQRVHRWWPLRRAGV
jgi:protein-S-isoprenylcysteine O-methyltransferase Ste14